MQPNGKNKKKKTGSIEPVKKHTQKKKTGQ